MLPPLVSKRLPAQRSSTDDTAQRPRVLVAGLSDLGIAVARLLVTAESASVRLFDPSPMREAEVGELLGLEGAGHARDQALTRRLENGEHSTAQADADATPVTSRLAALLLDVDVVVSCPGLDHRLLTEVTAHCRAAGVPLVTARIDAQVGVVSSMPIAVESGRIPGCPVCAELHRADRGDSHASAQLAANGDLAAVRDLAALAVCELLGTSRGERVAEGKAVEVDFVRRMVTVEPLIPHPACPSCRPAATPTIRSALRDVEAWHRDLARDALEPPTDLATLHGRLVHLVGKRYGLFSALTRNSDVRRHGIWKFFRARGVDPKSRALANAHAAAATRPGMHAGRSAPAISEGLDFGDPRVAEALALMEGLERVFALSHCDPGRIVEARFDQVAADALDPRDLSLYADWQYAQPGFPMQPFDPREPIRWLGGVDLVTARPLLVPFDFVYDHGRATALYRATSNGAACHASRRHALVNAIYEVVERDAFMVTWLHELALPRVTLAPQDPDPWELRATLDRLGLQLDHVDITVDTGIPVLLGVLRDRRNPGFFLLNMVANLDPGQRLRKLYRELAQFLYPYLVDQTHFVTERTFDPDPDKVVTFADHLAFYQSPERNERAAFLTASPHAASLPTRAPEPTPDVATELDVLLRRIAAAGLRVIAVDCTAPMLKTLGLHAVKVLIPGLQQLNAQHRLRSLGGERLLRVPERMGLDVPPRATDDLNPWPHPFW